jgi:hypothetical protein
MPAHRSAANPSARFVSQSSLPFHTAKRSAQGTVFFEQDFFLYLI